MRALTVIPRQADSIALSELEKPVPKPRQILARTRAIGICGTDHEIVRGEYGEAPPGAQRFIIGHESLDEVVSAP
jgi:threonine dehydrogenase-like Zn-dependent dehydrogenase